MKISNNPSKTKYTCYFTYLAMSSVFSLPPLLFVTFRETYGISYTLLGTLVLINFCTQLAVDLVFSFFSRYFNIKLTIRLMPVLTSVGLLIYALSPLLFPDSVYVGLVTGTFIFAIAAGLCEVLLSPLVAALPSETPEKDMSTLHSLFAYGVVTVVIISTLFFQIFGRENWMILTVFWAALPLISCFLFCTSPLPELNLTSENKSASAKKQNTGLALCVACIFLGSAAENTMSNWISGYMENALTLPKLWGDIAGPATFAIFLGIGRTLYARYGKKIINVLILSMSGSIVCYLAAGLVPGVIIPAIACALTGLCTSLLWPGSLIMMEEKLPKMGVAAYALMAAGGDFGASVAPQMMGMIVDAISSSSWGIDLASSLSLTPDQLGMKIGVLCATLFPIAGLILLLFIKKYFSKKSVADVQ